ncbi:MAG: hypothetical protein QM765_01090 [Myxococcales bacterium]
MARAHGGSAAWWVIGLMAAVSVGCYGDGGGGGAGGGGFGGGGGTFGGPDGGFGCVTRCGTSCCPAHQFCDQATFTCQASCVPNCLNRQCGDDGCGGICGSCRTGQTCELGLCSGGACVINCANRECGDDGCGGSCGTCGVGRTCAAGKCGAGGCIPFCTNRQCGPDGCGGTCGSCSGGQSCTFTGVCFP